MVSARVFDSKIEKEVHGKATNPALDEEEDTAQLLKIDNEELRPVNAPLWWAIDTVIATLATFYTHNNISIFTRLIYVAYILASSFIFQSLYFNCGLTRPQSGQARIDKWWHMLIVHFGNIFFYWEWSIAVKTQFTYWYTNNVSIMLQLIYILVGLYFVLWACDVIAGFVHWFGDTTEMYFFKYHHEDSRYMTRQSYVHHTWETFALAGTLSYFVIPFIRTNLIGISICLIASQTNECHMWAHCTSSETPLLIQFLQRLGVVLSWKAHRVHHRPPHLVDYCVFNGWGNPFMNLVLPGYLTNSLAKFRDSDLGKSIKKALNT